MRARKWTRPLAVAKRLAAGMRGVTGIDFGWGYKGEARERKRRLCIRFHVKQKQHEKELTSYEMLPREHMGIPCDVVQASYGLHTSPRDLVDPLRPGVSIGNLDRGTTGTLGAIVYDNIRKQKVLLSNWHVFCGSPEAKVGDTICQPGPAHAGSMAAKKVGTLERWLQLSQGFDAAVALIEPGTNLDERLFGLDFQVTGIEQLTHGMTLEKAGAVSGATQAVTDGIEGTYQVDYSLNGDSLRWMDAFRLVRPDGPGPDDVSLPGDSGSLWVDAASKKAVGLHFGGEEGLGPLADYALAQPIGKILSMLDLGIC